MYNSKQLRFWIHLVIGLLEIHVYCMPNYLCVIVNILYCVQCVVDIILCTVQTDFLVIIIFY